ncbi:hypothetical protein T310_1647 [Rasamsonia emersonii CBS 393.64]|uniref:Uncharacterized protein n=1 Tax=Rasamsonia emersonii (strain ATCC 16479 / CBS 393.64 / IMI 116815) TaxID=1408163 RepID=A0A0F4Z1U2_RASE3|nr:hypothetical protein T310_1647 [Rasamsonia emersonii CBS 393.64]KKA24320.1 hypothetical protein T310_1647 [Rasamsonia emersonii CBS 393.64]
MVPVAGDKYADDFPLLESEGQVQNEKDSSAARRQVDSHATRRDVLRRQSDFDDIGDENPVSMSMSQTTGLVPGYSGMKDGSTLSQSSTGPTANTLPRKSDLRYLSGNSFLLQMISPSSLRRSPRKERYSTLHELDDLQQQDAVTVDISFLEGPGIAKPVPSNLSSESAPPSKDTGTGPGALRVSSAFLPCDLGETVRQYGQRLADDKNMIVSVKEASPTVDLSTLEGSKTNLGHESFYYPSDPEQPNWKPFSMRSPYIAMLIFISLVLAAVQEYLFQRSQQGDGLIRYDEVSDIPAGEFFCWKYLPTMVMVCFGVLWQIMEYDIKRLEPYYQLSQPTGNTAAKTLNLDYVTMWAYFVPVKAIRYHHWTVAIVSVGAVLATTAAPSLQTASVAPVKNPHCRPDGACPGDFTYIVRIHPVWSRLVTATLITVAILAVILLFQLRRKSGLLSDPKGIAGVASMATKSHILTDFQGMDEATHDEIHKKLRHRRYVLYKSSIWQGEYIKNTATTTEKFAGHRKVENPLPIILRRGPGIAFIVFLAVCWALIPIVTYTGANVLVTSAPWLPILVAAVIKQLWTTLESAVKMLEPFYVLSQGNARPEVTLTLDYQGIPYGVLPVRALLNRHYLVALVGMGSILGDVLTVTASSLSLSLHDETVSSFIASSSLSTIITAFLVCAGAVTWARRRHPFLPRQPSTIASILAFIHQSRMLDDFVGTERYSSDEMRAMLVARGKRYGLGWFRGRDNKLHCGVDEEPMLSRKYNMIPSSEPVI